MPSAALRVPEKPIWRGVALQGWGRLERAVSLAARPERLRELRDAVASHATRNLVAHGAGRSYGDAALNAGGGVALTARLNRMLAFDPTTGVLAAEPGVTFAEVIETFLPRGWLPPTPPGTALATLGGGVANDVHGKNQHSHGSLGDHIEWLDLMTAEGDITRVSPQDNPALLAATIGGIGLTGIVTALGLRLLRMPSPAVRVRRRRIATLAEFLAGFDDSATWSVGWIDALSAGRGVLELAEPSAEPTPPPGARFAVPFDAPSALLNPLSVRAFNTLYWRRGESDGVQHLSRFLFPLDGIGAWNRLYGVRGFHQFQCVLPDAAALPGFTDMLHAVRAAGAASPLAVLKRMGRAGRGMLSFAQPGFTLALDIPASAESRALLARLEAITLAHQGRVYLAKDSALSPAGMAAMYPRLQEFQAMRDAVDPHRRFSSQMSRRLGLG